MAKCTRGWRWGGDSAKICPKDSVGLYLHKAKGEGEGGTFKGATRQGRRDQGPRASPPRPSSPAASQLVTQSWVDVASRFQADLTQTSKVPLYFFPYNPKDLQSRKPKDSFINKSIYLKEYVTINYTK